MIDIRDVARSIGYPAVFEILAVQDKFNELRTRDPLEFANDQERGDVPPTVAHVGLFFRPAVQASRITLAFTEPPA